MRWGGGHFLFQFYKGFFFIVIVFIFSNSKLTDQKFHLTFETQWPAQDSGLSGAASLPNLPKSDLQKVSLPSPAVPQATYLGPSHPPPLLYKVARFPSASPQAWFLPHPACWDHPAGTGPRPYSGMLFHGALEVFYLKLLLWNFVPEPSPILDFKQTGRGLYSLLHFPLPLHTSFRPSRPSEKPLPGPRSSLSSSHGARATASGRREAELRMTPPDSVHPDLQTA